MSLPFERTTCDCKQCRSCCERQPGPLVTGDLERIAEFLSEDVETAKKHFRQSEGALVKLRDGRQGRVGTITPKMRAGRCVFLDRYGRCSIHAVSPAGCALFDIHMSKQEAQPRSLALVQDQAKPAYQALRSTLDER